MAMKKVLAVALELISDGTDTVTVDLTKDPVTIQNGLGGDLINTFIEGRANLPTDVRASSTGFSPDVAISSATLAYPLVTVTWASTIPSGTLVNLFLNLLY